MPSTSRPLSLSLLLSLSLRSIALAYVAATWLLGLALGRRHHLFVANSHVPAALHSLVFDEESLQLNISRTAAADSSHSWITFNHDMTHVYGASLDAPRIATYDVLNNTALQLAGSVFARGRCFNRTAAFVLASKRFPHYVFSASWPGPWACGMSSYTNPVGGLMDVAQSWLYGLTSGIRGMAFGWGYGQVLYTADNTGDAIWTHAFGIYGEVYYMGRFPAPPGSRPRHIVTHPYGKYLFASMEGTGQLVAYVLDPYMGIVMANETAVPLIPQGQDAVNYGTSEVILSRNNRYLWAAARGKANTTYGGYLSGFLLDDDGFILKKMFTVQVSTASGTAHSITPAPWDDEWLALTDSASGYVQIWRMRGSRETDVGLDYTTAEAVARVEINDGGCCGNAIWYN